MVHHLPDSHLNSYVRFKPALTGHEPVIKPYDEARWADLADTAATPVETSIAMLEALHDRWVRRLRSMDDPAFARAWHGKHHVAQVLSVTRQG